MKKFVSLAALLTLFIGLSSCESDSALSDVDALYEAECTTCNEIEDWDAECATCNEIEDMDSDCATCNEIEDMDAECATCNEIEDM